MKATLTQAPQDLAAGSLHSITDFQGGVVRCLSGRLWITAEGHAQDVWLTAGGTLALSDPGKVVIQADIDSRFALVAPAQRPTLAASLQHLHRRLQRHAPASAAIGPNGKVMC